MQMLLIAAVAIFSCLSGVLGFAAIPAGSCKPAARSRHGICTSASLSDEAQEHAEKGTAHPLNLVPDSTVASAWSALVIPPLYTLRAFGNLRPQPFPRPSLPDKVAIVTGCNTGIGKRTALHLAETGATIVMAVRSEERGQAAKKALIKQLARRGVYSPKLEVEQVDLLSPPSMRAFAERFQAKHKKLDILVNNAGTNIPGVTEDRGLSRTFGVAYLGGFYLTNLLYDTIKNTPGARVVNMSSLLHHYGTTQWKAAASGQRGDGSYFTALFQVYCDAKLAQMIFTQELRRRFAQDGSDALAFAVSPGNVKSDIWRAVPLPVRIPADLLFRLAFLSTDEGCHTSVSAAVAPLERLGGGNGKTPALYLQPYGPLPEYARPWDTFGPFGGTFPTKASLPPNVEAEGERLWRESLEIIKAADTKSLNVSAKLIRH